MKAIVTGAAGFIGKHLIEKLLYMGYTVLGVDINEGENIIKCDITNPQFANWIEEGDKIIHLAAITTFERAEQNPNMGIRINVEGMMNVINCAIKKKVERIVFSSSGAVYSQKAKMPLDEDTSEIDPPSLYGLTKKMGEDLLIFHKDKVPFVILRYGYIYGNKKNWGSIGNFIRMIKEGKSPTIYGGKQEVDFVYVQDVVQATIKALDTENINQIYNIGFGKAIEIIEVYKIIENLLGNHIEPEIKPPRPFDLGNVVFNISKAKLLLGYNPLWSIENGLGDMLDSN